MRVVLVALCGALVASGLVIMFATPDPRRSEHGTAAAATTPFSTADPANTARVVPHDAYGRIALDDRVDRARRNVSGLAVPIAGAALPTDPELLPNAPREFRGGWHEGIDFPAASGTEVRAVTTGTVLRIDHAFLDWSDAEKETALAEAVALGYTPSATLDRIRGRQVWIDHGRGVVSRYAHLEAVAESAVGATVERGQVVGFVGSSGYPEGGPHLHLEIRAGTSYLGDGQSGEALLAAIAIAFDAR